MDALYRETTTDFLLFGRLFDCLSLRAVNNSILNKFSRCFWMSKELDYFFEGKGASTFTKKKKNLEGD